jgi:hypothetical protein
MPQVSTEGQERTNYLDRVTQILTDYVKMTGGIQSALLIDAEAEVEAIYSESSNQLPNLDSIGTATAQNMLILATKLQQSSKGAIKAVQEVEIVTESFRIFTLKVSTEPNYTLCLICPIKGAKAGVIKANFNDFLKEEIIAARQESQTRKKE